MEKPLILMLECDADDRLITESSFKERNVNVDIVFKSNSADFYAWLEGAKSATLPSLILLDMNAVPVNARDILRGLKSSPEFCHIPVVMLSELTSEKVIRDCYALGASSFIMKPDSVEQTDKKIMNFISYWFETVALA
jgi:CheY-like chemotaxis protein